ncbi:AAA family ATPase [Patescibacteria group bacterium AH-259-L07]|nr:AAA family ATPase [Patescibacteria group bacterium AH-259-L07]
MFNRKIINYLVGWKNKKERKPLILRGARQVGKTFAILMFGKKYFKNLIYINLEKAEHLVLFKSELSLDDFEKIIQIKFHQKIIPGKTLIFIDEIQNSPILIKLLRFFYEERPNIHVIAAGSLLQAKIEKEGFSLPVGRIEYAYLYPLDFFEYLEAKGEIQLLEFLKTISLNKEIPQGIHQQALKLFYEYTMVGGMPEIVKIFLEKDNIRKLKSVYSSLFTSYSEDVYKYSSSANVKYLTYIIGTAPLFAGTTITYEKFGDSNYRSREMNTAFTTLEKVMLLYQVQATKSADLPLIPQRKRPKKLLFLDVGLVNHQMGIQENYINLTNLNEFYRGKIAEQVVGQNIIAQFVEAPAQLFYWARERRLGSAEIDFCLNNKGKIMGIEVKSGKAGRLRSLYEFSKAVKNHHLMRIYGGELKRERVKVNNKSVILVSLPFYLTPRFLQIL